jgi:hypothetical protein
MVYYVITAARDKATEAEMIQDQKPLAALRLHKVPLKLGHKSSNLLIYDIMRFC